MVQERVVIVEDVPLGDGVVAVVGSEFCQCPIGDVFLSVRAILVVGVEGEALGITCDMKIWNLHQPLMHEKIFLFLED